MTAPAEASDDLVKRHTPLPWSATENGILGDDKTLIVLSVHATVKCGRWYDDYYACRNASATAHLHLSSADKELIVRSVNENASLRAQLAAAEARNKAMRELLSLDENSLADRIIAADAKLASARKALGIADSLVVLHRDYTTMPADDFDAKYNMNTRRSSERFARLRAEYVEARVALWESEPAK